MEDDIPYQAELDGLRDDYVDLYERYHYFFEHHYDAPDSDSYARFLEEFDEFLEQYEAFLDECRELQNQYGEYDEVNDFVSEVKETREKIRLFFCQ